MSSRALRRHHKARMKRRAVALYGRPAAAKIADHLASCSCPTCGNRRPYDGPTRQERRAPTADYA